MRGYCVTLNSDTGTGDNVWVELVPASGVVIAIYKIIFGQSTTPGDTIQGRVRVFRETTAGTGMAAGTVVELNPFYAAPTTTCNVKQTGVFAGSGTTTDLLLDTDFNGRQAFEWTASSPKNYLYSGAGERITVRLVTTVAMGNASMTVFFKE